MKQKLVIGGCGFALLLVLLDGQTAQEGVRQGLALCGRSVLPALLPFFVLSRILTDRLWGKPGSMIGLLGRLFRMPTGGECLLIPAFLGGYPAGAAAVGDVWKADGLRRQEAERLLGWCSNPGPSFLFGICGGALPGKLALWYLWSLLIFGALAAAWLIPGKPSSANPRREGTPQDLMVQTVVTMGKICVTVILFRVIICYWNAYSPLVGTPNILAEGLLELTNGCCDLTLLPVESRMAAAGLFLSLGGLCVLFQTRAVTQGLSLKWYFVGKGIQAAVCLLGAWRPMALILVAVITALLKILVAFWMKQRYNGGNTPFRRKLCFSGRK